MVSVSLGVKKKEEKKCLSTSEQLGGGGGCGDWELGAWIFQSSLQSELFYPGLRFSAGKLAHYSSREFSLLLSCKNSSVDDFEVKN